MMNICVSGVNKLKTIKGITKHFFCWILINLNIKILKIHGFNKYFCFTGNITHSNKMARHVYLYKL